MVMIASGGMFSLIISLFTIFLYTALGSYILAKNPHESSNKIFALLMLAFIMWAVGTYNMGLIEDGMPSGEIIPYIKIQLSGVVLALTFLVFFALSLTKGEKILKNPLAYLTFIPSIYMLYLIWMADITLIEPNIFTAIAGTKKEFFLFSTIFGVAGVYLLLRHYMASKYRQREMTKLILMGTIAATFAAVTINIIMPMFFDIYFLVLSTLAPAVLGIFFAYAVYQYGFFITPMPEVSVTSFCGTDCILCPDFIEKQCAGCKLDSSRYKDCEAYKCLTGKGYSGCGDCPEILTCTVRKAKQICFSSKPKHELKPATYVVENGSYELFLEAIKNGAFGIVASTTHPMQIREKYDLKTIPIIWISDEAFDMGVKPGRLGRLSVMLINSMKTEKLGNAVVLLDGVDRLIEKNNLSSVQNFIHLLNSTAHATNSSLIIPSGNEKLSRLCEGLECVHI